MIRVRVILPATFEEEFDVGAVLAGAAYAAEALSAPLDVVIITADGSDALVQQAKSYRAARIWVGQHTGLPDRATAQQMATVCAEAVGNAGVSSAPDDTVLTLLPSCNAGVELAARLSVRLQSATLGRIAKVRADAASANDVIVTRTVFSGRAAAELRFGGHGFAVLDNAAPKAEPAAGDVTVPVQALVLSVALPLPVEVTSAATEHGARRLQGSKVVVSGGRGMRGPEGFSDLLALAELLGGALGGSLPSVDAGWVPVSRQVGQSGNYVQPELYVAVGISGTAQHLAGIGNATRIVAINNDPDADIFKVAEIGCVATWQEIVPRLVEQLRTPG